jgi:hypothetical protein
MLWIQALLGIRNIRVKIDEKLINEPLYMGPKLLVKWFRKGVV